MSVKIPFKIHENSNGSKYLHIKPLVRSYFKKGEEWMGEFADDDTLILKRNKMEEQENVRS